MFRFRPLWAGLLLVLPACGGGAAQIAQSPSNPTPAPTLAAGPSATRPPDAALAPTPAPVPTAIVNRTAHGHIRWNETWRGEFHVTGDIQVEPGFTLTIEPGSRILVAANSDAENLNMAPFDLQQGLRQKTPGSAQDENSIQWGEPFRDEANHISIRILGTLRAVGTPQQLITITSDSSTPGFYDWNVFQFGDGVLSYATVEYYRYMFVPPGAQVPPTISHNTLRHIGENAIGSANGTTAIVIEDNAISDTGHELIDMHNASLVIRNNHLGPNFPRKNPGGYFSNGVGIILDGGQPQIIGNTIDSTNIGMLYLSPTSGAVIQNNVFTNNGQDAKHP